jgi:hypothetical protein
MLGLFVLQHPRAAEAQGDSDYAAQGEWRQFGGPGRDFQVEASGLAENWPESGPTQVWSRPLGPGHSSVIVDNGRLFTMYRPGAEGEPWANEETVVALDTCVGPLSDQFSARPLAST